MGGTETAELQEPQVRETKACASGLGAEELGLGLEREAAEREEEGEAAEPKF